MSNSTNKTVEQRLKEVIVEQLSVDESQLKPETSFIDDLGADSLDAVEVLMAIEEEFGFEISDEDAEKLQTFGKLQKYVEDRAKQ